VYGTEISADDLLAMKATVDWLARLQTNDGNLPSSLETQHVDLVQFCHGAPGLVLLLTEAIKSFPDMRTDWLRRAEKAGLCVWRKGLLVKGVGEFTHPCPLMYQGCVTALRVTHSPLELSTWRRVTLDG
jgi:hypothetical protein